MISGAVSKPLMQEEYLQAASTYTNGVQLNPKQLHYR